MGIMATLVDDKGRVLVPKDLRERFGLEPGCAVIIEADGHGIRLRRAIPVQEALRRLMGIIPADGRKPSMDPLDIKRIWEPKL